MGVDLQAWLDSPRLTLKAGGRGGLQDRARMPTRRAKDSWAGATATSKPANILVDNRRPRDGDGFGLVCATESKPVTVPTWRPNSGAGESLDPRTDIYAYGASSTRCLRHRFLPPEAVRTVEVRASHPMPVAPRMLQPDLPDEMEPWYEVPRQVPGCARKIGMNWGELAHNFTG